MNELVFLKLGGSLLTDKTRPQALRGDVLQRLAAEIAAALAERPDAAPADRPRQRLVRPRDREPIRHARDGVQSPAARGAATPKWPASRPN